MDKLDECRGFFVHEKLDIGMNRLQGKFEGSRHDGGQCTGSGTKRKREVMCAYVLNIYVFQLLPPYASSTVKSE